MWGNGSFDNFYNDAPWTVPIDGAVTYALVQIGYHAGDTLSHLIVDEKRNDFYEMFLHHLCAVLLLLLSLLSNQIGIGCVIVYSHDVSEVMAKLVKIFSCCPYDYATVTVFVMMVVSWVWTRNFFVTYLTTLIW